MSALELLVAIVAGAACLAGTFVLVAVVFLDPETDAAEDDGGNRTDGRTRPDRAHGARTETP